MKQIKTYIEQIIDDKDIIILSNKYKGTPLMYHQYDILIGPKEIITKYYKQLIPDHNLKKGWKPKVLYLNGENNE